MIKALACKNKSIEDRLNSSSGGLFILVARAVINSGGVVYGAAFDDDFSVTHIRVTEQAELVKLCNSKYAFSNFRDAMNQCKQDLKTVFVNGQQVSSIPNQMMGGRGGFGGGWGSFGEQGNSGWGGFGRGGWHGW